MCKVVLKDKRCSNYNYKEDLCSTHWHTFDAHRINKSFEILEYLGTVDTNEGKFCHICRDIITSRSYYFDIKLNKGVSSIRICTKCLNNYTSFKDKIMER